MVYTNTVVSTINVLNNGDIDKKKKKIYYYFETANGRRRRDLLPGHQHHHLNIRTKSLARLYAKTVVNPSPLGNKYDQGLEPVLKWFSRNV